MKKKEVDVFAIVIGIVIGFIFGFFLSMRINNDKTSETGTDDPIFGNVYLLQVMKASNLNDLNNTLSGAEFAYEIIKKGDTYYVYTCITSEKAIIDTKKEEFEDLGFMPMIKNEYILDWPNYYVEDVEKFDFYVHAITNLLKSLDNENIIIDEQYFLNPVDLEVFSNLTLLQSIKNSEIKMQIQLETYRILFEKLN